MARVCPLVSRDRHGRIGVVPVAVWSPPSSSAITRYATHPELALILLLCVCRRCHPKDASTPRRVLFLHALRKQRGRTHVVSTIQAAVRVVNRYRSAGFAARL